LWARILSAVTGDDERPTFGAVDFNQAQFTGAADFTNVVFIGEARFWKAKFHAEARFEYTEFGAGGEFDAGAEFSGAEFMGLTVFHYPHFYRFAWFLKAQFTGASFDGAEFEQDAHFGGASFGSIGSFKNAKFKAEAGFGSTQCDGEGDFSSAEFGGPAIFNGSQFRGGGNFTSAQFGDRADFFNAGFNKACNFNKARFEKANHLGPIVAEEIHLQDAVFIPPITIEAAAGSVACNETIWKAGVTMRLRYAKVELDRATFTVPSIVAGADQPFSASWYGDVDENSVRDSALQACDVADDPWMPILSSLRGVDTFNLSVTDVNLSQCRFAGALLLDQLRLEGRCVFDRPPPGLRVGWALPPIWQWSRRQSLAEERSWRATKPKFSGWADVRSPQTAEVQPERIAGLYRQLRKALEDAKNEPGAADFYYGEMEMRRHARITPAAERTIVWLYWLISGYGLRALRSLAALVVVGVIVTTVLTGWGLAATAPITTPPQHLSGTVITTPHKPAQIDATLSGITPQLPPASQRWTSERTRTALEVTFESLVFRSTDQQLTTVGTWTTIAARILGPVLLALALLAIRNRVKR
jgi:uncharacterized protein YjbI with pentapeptide repeats